jgi:hypothetical protein
MKDLQDRHNIANKIKSSHFKFGDLRNDYGTTNNENYHYDKISSGNSIVNLDKKTINDIRGTHFKLGYIKDQPQTTHQSSYVVLKNVERPDINNNVNRKNNISLKFNNNGFEGKTIYMNDYTIKSK